MSVNCNENCGRLRKMERTVVSVDDMRTIARDVLRFVAGLASQAAIVIAVLSTSAASVVRHMIRKRFYTIFWEGVAAWIERCAGWLPS